MLSDSMRVFAAPDADAVGAPEADAAEGDVGEIVDALPSTCSSLPWFLYI
jgi:hypothetical protein